MPRHPIRFTPFHLAGALFLLAGLVLAVYHGLEQFHLVPRVGWVSWSHIHFVTIGGFTQLLFGMLPQLTARKLERPLPSKYYDWLNFVGLNGGFLLLWYGRGWGHTWAFDGGLIAIWLLVAGLLIVMLRMVMQSDLAWNATTGLYLVSVFVFLWGITYAYGLFAHVWQVPGGWLGLREAHVHANAWGFLGLAAIATLYDLFPRLLGTDLYSERLRDYSAWFLVAGIFPLITGPWIGMGRTVTATGLVLFATGFALYLYTLVQTYGQWIPGRISRCRCWQPNSGCSDRRASHRSCCSASSGWIRRISRTARSTSSSWGGRSPSRSPVYCSISGTSPPRAKGVRGAVTALT